ncbi:hypothetical protein PTKIN_Ptkin14bG0180300 [Pterospermum kingtungense]
MVVVLLPTFFATLSAGSPNITTDQLALLALKSHISHDPQNLLATNWSTNTSVCNWVGVTCGSKHHRVTSLNLSYMGLTGTISPHLGNLSFLAWLDICHNGFHGSIPIEIANLQRLKYLNFGNNNFTGGIPSTMGNFSKLEMLGLSDNSLNGHIPATVGNLSKLKYLYLENNQLSGEIPSAIGNLTALDMLDLSHDRFTDVGNNNFNDTFPNWLGNLDHLQVLVLRSNRFHGPIDGYFEVTVPLLSGLCVIDLSYNEFSGYLPTKFFESLSPIRDEYEKKVKPEYMTGVLLAHRKLYYNLSISFTSKGLETDFEAILKVWKAIDFSNNQFFGEIPKAVGELHSLIVLNLSHNSLTGPIPSSLGNLSELESLDLSSNKLSGRIPAQLKNLIFLEVVNLSHNFLVGPIPKGNQLDTFPNDSYIGNLGLCGFPLSTSCSNNGESKPTPTKDHFTGGFNWKTAMLIGYGCGVVLGLSMGYIIFTTGKPWWFVKMIERAEQKYITGKIRRSKGGRKY